MYGEGCIGKEDWVSTLYLSILMKAINLGRVDHVQRFGCMCVGTPLLTFS